VAGLDRPEQVRRWWGPTGFTCPLARMEVREGGTSLVAMPSPEGQDLSSTWVYRSVVPHQLSKTGLEQVPDKLAASLQQPRNP
jgi:uncharacterized protein YndB with AHSA1/START domain